MRRDDRPTDQGTREEEKREGKRTTKERRGKSFTQLTYTFSQKKIQKRKKEMAITMAVKKRLLLL